MGSITKESVEKIAKDLIACEVESMECDISFEQRYKNIVLIGFLSLGYEIDDLSFGYGWNCFTLSEGGVIVNLYFK